MSIEIKRTFHKNGIDFSIDTIQSFIWIFDYYMMRILHLFNIHVLRVILQRIWGNFIRCHP